MIKVNNVVKTFEGFRAQEGLTKMCIRDSPATGNEQVYQAPGRHQLPRRLAGGVLHQLECLAGQAGRGQPILQGSHNGGG